jgi:glycosyltransferase involved in cell wall biosynthesis
MSKNGQDIGVVIPAFNEERTIDKTIKALKQVACIDRILVVDDGSSDSTAELASESGAEVLKLPQNSGKGHAMKMGYEALPCSVLIFLDADLGETAAEAIRLIDPICGGNAEATISRFPMTPGKGGFGFVKRLSSRGLFFLTGQTFSSVLSGQRGFLRKILSEESFRYSGFGIEFGMTVDLLWKNRKIREVDVTMEHRTTGRDFGGFLHRARQFMDIAIVIVRKAVEKSSALPKGNDI